MEMHQVRSFLAVARHLNFTRAADELRVAQPSLTRAIQKLEAELHGPLFRRERLNTHLTELGRMMLPHLTAAFDAAEGARAQAQRLKVEAIGSLSLGVCGGIGADAPAALVLAAAGKLVHLGLSVEVAPTDLIERRLIAGEFDAAILAPATPVHERFDLHTLIEDDFVVAFAEGHRFAALQKVPIDALDAEPLVSQLGCQFDEAIRVLMEGLGLKRSVSHRSNDPIWIAALVRGGLGCAILPEALARANALTYRELQGVSLRHRTVLATVAGRQHSLALSTLLRAISGTSVDQDLGAIAYGDSVSSGGSNRRVNYGSI